MATPVLIPVSEYLRTTYRPDCDYIDGEVKERHLGETPHATIQSLLTTIFFLHRSQWQVRAYTEQRLQVRENNYRVPDVCVTRLGSPPGPILLKPPLICIEVLSPEDSLSDIRPRVADYVAMGVQHVWVIDPVRRLVWLGTEAGLQPHKEPVLAVAGTPIRIALADIYTELDEMAAGR